MNLSGGLFPPTDEEMNNLHHLESRFRYTVCAALRDIYKEIEDPELRLKLKYAVMLSKAGFYKLRIDSPIWMKSFWPRREDFDGLMRGK